MTLPVLEKGEEPPLLTCWQYFAQDTVSLLCSKGTLLAPVQLAVHQDPGHQDFATYAFFLPDCKLDLCF